MSIILNIEEAACFLMMGKQKLLNLVARGKIPGAKIGRRWIFIEDDLLSYIRSLYKGKFDLEQIDGATKWDCTSKEISGGSLSPTVATEYAEALGLKINKKPNSFTTSLGMSSGRRKN